MYKHNCGQPPYRPNCGPECGPKPGPECCPKPGPDWCPQPSFPGYCPPPAHPPAPCMPPSPSVVEGQSLYEAVNNLTCKVNTCIATYNDVMRNCYETLRNLQRAAEENGAYYGECEVRVEQGYYAEENAKYYIIRKAKLDRCGKPIKVELALAYGNTTNSMITQDIFSASQVNYADKIFTAIPQSNIGWYGIPIWRGAPIPTDTTQTHLYTVGFTRHGNMKVYMNTATSKQLLNDNIENAMGCSGVLIQNGQITDEAYQANIPNRTEKTQRVVMGQNTDNGEVIWLVCGATNTEDNAGLTSAACAQILIGYGVDIAVEISEGLNAGAADKGQLMFTPADNQVPATYCYWVISRKCFYKNDFERELAELSQKYGELLWNQELQQGDFTNKIEDINNEIENLESLYQQLSSKLDVETQEREEADKQLQAAIDAINVEIDAIKNEITDLSQKIDDEVAELNAAITEINQHLTTIDQTIENINSELMKQDSLITSIQENMTYLETALNNLKSTIEEFRTQLRETINKVDQIISGDIELPYLPIAGGTMTGPIDMGGQIITNLPEPTNNSDAVTKEYVDRISPGTIGRASKTEYGVVKIGDGIQVEDGVISVTGGAGGSYLPLAGGEMDENANITMSGGTVKDIPTPAEANDAANKAYVDKQISDVTSNVPEPTEPGDIVNKEYVDNAVESVKYSLPVATAEVLGGVKVGTGLTIDPEGVLSATGGSGPGEGYLPLAGGTMDNNASITMQGSGTITGIPTPVNDSDAANKAYVDTAVENSLGNVSTPTNPNDAVNKEYVDNAIATAGNGKFLPLAGGTMTGKITGIVTPTENADAVNKEYVDAQIAEVEGEIASNIPAPVNPTDAANKEYVDQQIENVEAQLDNYLPLAGGTMTGKITGIVNPTENADAANKGYVDSQIASVSSGIQTDIDEALGNVPTPTDGTDAANKEYVDNAVANAGSGIYLPLAGGTMSGNIILPANTGITNASGALASNGQVSFLNNALNLFSPPSGTVYVGRYGDSISIDGNDLSMTNGTISNLADPVNAQDAATKAYVDAHSSGGISDFGEFFVASMQKAFTDSSANWKLSNGGLCTVVFFKLGEDSNGKGYFYGAVTYSGVNLSSNSGARVGEILIPLTGITNEQFTALDDGNIINWYNGTMPCYCTKLGGNTVYHGVVGYSLLDEGSYAGQRCVECSMSFDTNPPSGYEFRNTNLTV